MNLASDFEVQFSGFHDLMKFRVREILLVSSLYDAFVLEEDGRLAERIFSEYLDLNLHFIPRIYKVSTAEEALRALQNQAFDLVITMARISDMNPIEFGQRVKEMDPEKPVVLLTYDVIDPVLLEKIREVKSIDKVFYWSGESKILLAIIKYVEDLKNVPYDAPAGVQVILIIEDSPKFYSLFLPYIYTEIMTQTRLLISDGVNDLHRMLRMRARPKILMAESLEDGLNIYEAYKHNLLGIISDVRFPNQGVLDAQAGLLLAEKVKSEVSDLPILLQSSDDKARQRAEQLNATYLNKSSPNLGLELKNFILHNFGFGEFIFRHQDGTEICRARNLTEFTSKIPTIPIESLEYHARRNHISIWLRARTEFELADELRPIQVSDFSDAEEMRNFILKALQRRIDQLQLGVIKDFGSSQYYADNTFIRIGSGSLGGKGRGLAFINALLANSAAFGKFPDIDIKTPQTFVLGTEVFEEFMEMNNLQEFAVNCRDEEKIAARFLDGKFPANITHDLFALLEKISYPLAVRSSSLLEDSQLLPFAGMYRTYMIPNNHVDLRVRAGQLLDAIRLVYASVYFQNPKEYVKNSGFRIEEEKMAVIIQQVAGVHYGQSFYPVISGVAQSYNFYPISHMKPEDGIVHLAMGLGKIITDGEQIYRFSPAYPQMNLPYSSALEYVKNSQSSYLTLDIGKPGLKVQLDENFSLKKLEISEAENDGTLFFIGSSYSPEDGRIQDSLHINGPRVITFANILKYNIFPLSDLLQNLLSLGKTAFGTHVEIEFAINLYKKNTKKPEFYILQIRPMIAGNENYEVSVDSMDPRTSLCFSNHAIGNGIFRNIFDLIYVKPEDFDISKSDRIAMELDELNQSLDEEQRNYILLGFGRWGTADPWLGIPVEWHNISQAKVLIETSLGDFNIEPSSGSHFFHNLISLRLGYFSIRKMGETEHISWDWIRRQPAYRETKFLRHLRFEHPFVVKIDGRTSTGLILKPNGQI